MTSTTSGSVGAGSRGGPADDVAVVADEPESGADIEIRHGKSRGFWVIAVSGSVVLFLAHLLQIAQLRSPIIYFDEGGYLGNARYMVSGYGRNGGNYFAGYSLLLTPAAAFTHAATAFFHGVLLTNSVLAVVTAVLAYLLARELVPEAPDWVPLVVAGTVAACPFVFTFVGIAMSENGLIPTTLLAAVLVARAARTGSWPARIGVVAASAFAYWVTPRGVIVSAAGLLALLILTFEARRSWRAFAIELATMVIALGAGQLFEDAVRGNAHVTGVTGRPHGLLSALFHPSQWRMSIAGSLGRFAYLGLASAGFILVGVVVGLVWLAPRAGRSATDVARIRRSVSAFAVVAVVGTAVADAVAIAGVPVLLRLDYVYYGRYAEAVAMPALVIGASWLLTSACSRDKQVVRRVLAASLVTGASIAVMALLTRTLTTHRPADSTLNPVTVLALYPIHVRFHAPTVTKQLLIGAVIVTVVLVLVSFRVRVFALLPIVALAAGSVVVHDQYLRPGSQSRGTQGVLAHAVARLGDAGVPISCVDAQLPIASFWFLANYQFLQPKTKFELYPGSAKRSCPLVITSDRNWGTNHPDDRLVAVENDAPVALWLTTSMLKPAVRAAVTRAGLSFPGSPCTALPPDAYRATVAPSVNRTLTGATGLRGLQVALDVRHDGAGAPWLGSHSLLSPDGCGRVEVVLAVEEDGAARPVFQRTVQTPDVLFPSETWHLHTPVAGPAAPPVLAADHTYRLRVRLVQHGVRFFGGPDGNGVTVPLGSINGRA